MSEPRALCGAEWPAKFQGRSLELRCLFSIRSSVLLQ